jgi:hypothetical protein
VTVDHVFVPARSWHAGQYNASQEAIYEAIGQPVVANAMEGQSNAVAAFGASGSG